MRALAVLPNGVLASAGFDAAIIWWDAAAGRARRLAPRHAGALNALVALPRGRLASAGKDGQVAIWPAGGGAEPARVPEDHAGPVMALAVSPEGALASVGWDGRVLVWAAEVVAGVGAPDGTIASWPPDLGPGSQAPQSASSRPSARGRHARACRPSRAGIRAGLAGG